MTRSCPHRMLLAARPLMLQNAPPTIAMTDISIHWMSSEVTATIRGQDVCQGDSPKRPAHRIEAATGGA